MRSPVRHKLADRSGATLLWVVLFGAVLGLVSIWFYMSLSRDRQYAVDERAMMEARMIAGDMLELGKYLLMYERAFYIEDPVLIAGGRSARGDALRALWGAPPNAPALIEACGSYDLSGFFLGNGTVGGERVFCPSRLRDPELSGPVIEQMFLEQYLARGILEDGGRAGSFFLEIDLTASLDPANAADSAIPLYQGQRFLREYFETGLDAIFSRTPISARLRFEFLSDSAAFVAVGSERYVRIVATLLFDGARGLRHQIQKAETVMVSLSTPKQFALFMPYPITAPSIAVPNGTPTTSFSAAVVKPATANVTFRGRVFFNGNLDVPLANLPTFAEGLVVSGNVFLPTGAVPGPDQIDVLREKFPKGMVTHFSAPRFVMDGACADNAGTPVPVVNGTQFNCGAFDIVNYIQRMGNGCWDMRMDSSCGNMTPTIPAGSPAFTNAECGTVVVNQSPIQFVHGGLRELNLSSSCSAAITPAVVTRVSAGTNVYGSLFGGHLNIGGDATFWVPEQWRTGLPGVASDSALAEFNSASIEAYGGVSVPLLNMPTMMATGGESQ